MSRGDNGICYLCNEPLGEEKPSEDHVVPKQFIKRSQPKTKGFLYGGTLVTHESCNNRFGGAGAKAESMCQKALALLNALYDEKTLYRQKRSDPEIRIAAITSDQLPSFTEDDKRYFGLIDVVNEEYETWTSREYLAKKQKIDPFRSPVNIGLSVLAKSAIAHLLKLQKIPLKSVWRIIACPFHGKSGSAFDFDHILGKTQPFEIGVKLWAKPIDNGDWFAAYKAENLLVFFCINISDDPASLEELADALGKGSILYFGSSRLLDLAGYDWSANKYGGCRA